MTWDGEERREGQEALVREVAHGAAREAVHETFQMFGYDTKDSEDVRKLQGALQSAERFNDLSKKAGTRVFLTLLTMAVVGAATVVWHTVTGQ